MGDTNAYMILVQEFVRNWTLGRQKRRWEGDVNIGLREIDSEVSMSQLAHDRVLCRSLDLAVLNQGFPLHQFQLLNKAERKVGRRAACTAVTLFFELNQTVTVVFARNTVGQDREGMKFITGVPMLKKSSRFGMICWSIG